MSRLNELNVVNEDLTIAESTEQHNGIDIKDEAYEDQYHLVKSLEEYPKSVGEFGFSHFDAMKKMVLPEKVDKEENIVVPVNDKEKPDAIEASFGGNTSQATKLVSVKEMRLKNALNMMLVKQVARILKIGEEIDEDGYVSLENAEKIIKECNRRNREKANTNNPNYYENGLNPCQARATMGDLMHQYNVSMGKIIEIAEKLNIPNIWNQKSYASDANIQIIIDTLTQKDTAAPAICAKEDGPFEALLQKDYKIFIDSSSLMNLNMPSIMDQVIIPLLKKYERVVYITDSVLYEIGNKLKYPYDIDSYEKAKLALKTLKKLNEDELYHIPETGSVSKKFADAELITVFTDLRVKYNLCLITNDNRHMKQGGLSGSISRLKEDPNIDKIFDIKVYAVSQQANDTKVIEFSTHRDINFMLHENAPLRVKL